MTGGETQTVDAPTLRAATDTDDLREGMAIGRYRLGRRLGQGGMGIVHAAYDPKLERQIAIKVLHGSATRDPEGRARLLREARAMAQLSHPNVVEVYDVGHIGDRVFIAMELVDGTTLGRWAEARKPRWLEVVDAMIGVGRGLAAAHSAGLVHRDFKPGNVLVGDDGRFKVADFGIAVSAAMVSESPVPHLASTGSGEQRLTRTGLLVGTPAYMAPEQWDGRPSEKSDQFSFCASLFVALFGRRPFSGSTAAQLRPQVRRGPEVPSAPSVPRWLWRIMERGLAFRPDDRFENMDALVAQLVAGRRRAARRPWLWGAAGLVGVAGATSLWSVAQSGSAIGCEPDTLLQSVWNDDVKTEIEQAFAQSGASYGAATHERVEAGLDAYADRWAQAYQQTCTAMNEPSGPEATTFDVQMECLRRQLTGFGALAGALADADAGVVEQAGGAVAKLPGPTDCADADATDVAPPEAEIAARVRSARQRLAEAFALFLTGKFEAAAAIVDRVDHEADAVAYPPLTAETELLHGRLEEETAAYPEAEDHYERAFHTAAEASYDVLAVRAAARLAFLHAHRTAHLDQALEWARHGQTYADRLGADSRYAGDVANALGVVHFRRGDYEKALREYERALEIWAEHLPDTHPSLAGLASNMAALNGALERHDVAMEHAKRCLTISEAMYGEAHPQVGAAHNNVAAAAFRLGRYDEAQRHYELALSIRRAALGPAHPDVADTLANVGLLLRAKGEPDAGIAALQESLRIREQAYGTDHPSVAASLNNLGDSLLVDRRYEEAYRAFARACEIFRAELGPEHVNVAMCRHNEGTALVELGRPADGLAACEEAAQLWRAALGEEHPFVGHSLLARGKAKLALGQTRDAIAHLERALPWLDESERSPEARADVRWALARARATTGNEAQARRLAEEAQTLYREAGPTRAHDLADVTRWLERQ